MEKFKRVFGQTELILSENRIYHLDLQADDIADTILTVGDPNRVEKVARYFDSVEFRHQHREFATQTGHLNGQRITVMSTGMGTQNIDIFMNELDALVNIDFEERTVKDKLRTLTVIRLGTTGGLQKSIPLNSFVVSEFAIDLTGLLHYYTPSLDSEEDDLTKAFTRHLQACIPFIGMNSFRGDDGLIQAFAKRNDCIKGITLTCHGFYLPQGRQLRAGDCNNNYLIEHLSNFKFNDLTVTNLEMETAALYGFSRLLGHKCCSINIVIANRMTQQFTGSAESSEKKLIECALETLF